jgi:hypothetical protein
MRLMDEIKSRIQAKLARGECVQIVSLPGMGASRLGISLGGLFISPNQFTSVTTENFMAAVSGEKPDLIILDRINEILLPELKPFFHYLKGLRDQRKYKLKYVFINRGHSPLGLSAMPVLGDLFSLVSENIIFLTPVPETEITARVLNDFAPNIEFTPTASQIGLISDLTGGIPAFVKIAMQALRDGNRLDPDSNPRLLAQLEEFRLALGDNPSPQTLKSNGLLDQTGRIRSRLLRTYLEKHSPVELSAAETRLLDLLQKTPDSIVTKDAICTAVYPDVKNRTGISDHAIDQLVHRLREKISDRYALVTHRGLGYKLKIR